MGFEIMTGATNEQCLRDIKRKLELMRGNHYDESVKGELGPEVERARKHLIRFGEARLRREKPHLVSEYEAMDREKRLSYLCSIFPPDKPSSTDAMVKRFKTELGPLLSRVYSVKFGNEIKTITNPTVYSQVENACLAANLMFRSKMDEGVPKGEQTYQMLSFYKTEIEGLFTFLVNYLVLALIMDGHTYYRNKKQLITLDSMGRIRKERLADKLQFLSKSGFSYFADSCNRIIRNSGSHEQYKYGMMAQSPIGGTVERLPSVKTILCK